MLAKNGGIDLTPRHEPFDLAEQTRHDYAREWGIAHGLLPEPPPMIAPHEPGHFCPARNGWFWSGSRAACPHCKIEAPRPGVDAGPGIE
jgi:hypothetical protein